MDWCDKFRFKNIGGMGGCTLSGLAYQVQNRQTYTRIVNARRAGIDIKFFEFLALLALVTYMAPKLEYKHIRYDTVVWAVSKKRGPLERRDLHWMVNLLCEYSVKYKFRFWIEYIKGNKNIVADRLSRFKDLYADNKIKQQFEYISTLSMVNIMNDILIKMLDVEKSPLNYNDPLRVKL